MLEKLLDEIRLGGTLEVGALAARLDTTPELVTVMLEHLQRIGVVSPYEQMCVSFCEGCTLKGTCQAQQGVRGWQGQER